MLVEAEQLAFVLDCAKHVEKRDVCWRLRKRRSPNARLDVHETGGFEHPEHVAHDDGIDAHAVCQQVRVNLRSSPSTARQSRI